MKTNKYLLHIFILLASCTIKAQGFEKLITHKNQYATIIGLVPESAGIDSVRLILYPENTSSELSLNITGMTTFTSKVKDGRYSFDIPVNDKLLYFSLYKKNAEASPERKDRLLNFHLVEKGDYVVINHFGPKLTFCGIGSAKHTLHVLFSNEDGYAYHFDNPELFEKPQLGDNITQYNLRCEDTLGKGKRLLQLLERSKAELSEKAYQVLYCEIIGNCQYPLIRLTRNLTENKTPFKIAQSDKDAIKLQFKSAQKKLMRSRFSDSITASSIRYVKYYAELLNLQRALKNDTIDLVKYIVKSTGKSQMRDKLLISIFGLSYKRYGKSIQLAIDHMHSPALRNDLVNFHDKQKNGAIMPGTFLLSDHNNKEINLLLYKGKVIFLDFWYIGCVPCADYYKTTVSVAKKSFIDSKDVVFITVCTEKDYKKWISALQSDVYTSKSAVNLFTRGIADHPLIKYFNVVSAPTPILIDKNFKIFSRDEILLGRGGNPSSLINTIKLCINY